MALAGIYPTVIKFIATWFKKGRGFAMGIMLSALTLGSAMPHLIRAVGVQFDWKLVIIMSSLACLIAAVLFAFVLHDGPHQFSKTKTDVNQLGRIIRDRPVMLANMGYFGHMWELYAMWGWFFAYAIAAKSTGLGLENAALLTFLVIAAGAPGCVMGGWLADRIGRCYATIFFMVISGTSALLSSPLMFMTESESLFIGFLFLWGMVVIADSPLFSTLVAQNAAAEIKGTALTIVTCIGFSITIISIQLLNVLQATMNPIYIYTTLALGPIIGLIVLSEKNK